MPQTPLDPREFRNALGRFATGVTVVTTRAQDGAPVGITANSFASVSLEPALVLWSAAKSSSRHDCFAQAEAFAIHILAQDQQDIAQRFTRNGAGFAGLELDPSAEDVPLLRGVLARFECRREAVYPGGDHTIIVGRVQRFASDEGAPLLFSQGAYAAISGGFRA